ncbi:MAG: hypothetical protein IKX62_00840 [Bacteroidales bacterium]|nr:hypothetical protein [Bacteroidales bacterium]
MSLIAKLQFGNNGALRYDKEYTVVDFKCHILRSHNEARPEGCAQCDQMELTVVAPGKSDLNLYEWYEKGTTMSGRVLIEMPSVAFGRQGQWKMILFEDCVCFAIEEEYHIDKSILRTLKLRAVPAEIIIDDIVFKSQA